MVRIFLILAILVIPFLTSAEGPTLPTNGGKSALDTPPTGQKFAASPGKATPTKKIPKARRKAPSAVTGEALSQELRRAALSRLEERERLEEERKRLENEKIQTARERRELQDLMKKIDAARQRLKRETSRMERLLIQNEELIEKGGCPKGLEGGRAAIPVGGPTLGLSKNARIKSLSKAVRNMKPKEAASLFRHLDRDIAVELLRRMPARQAGAVLSALKPVLAAQLATDLATDPNTGELE